MENLLKIKETDGEIPIEDTEEISIDDEMETDVPENENNIKDTPRILHLTLMITANKNK